MKVDWWCLVKRLANGVGHKSIKMRGFCNIHIQDLVMLAELTKQRWTLCKTID